MSYWKLSSKCKFNNSFSLSYSRGFPPKPDLVSVGEGQPETSLKKQLLSQQQTLPLKVMINTPEILTNLYTVVLKCNSFCKVKRSFEIVLMITVSVLPVDNVGRMVLAGGAAVGLGALCYYGLGMSNEIGAIERAV